MTKKWLRHFVQIVNNSKAFLKTSHTHSLSFYFMIFQITTRHRKRAYLFKNKKNLKKNKSMVLLCYSTLPYSTWKYKKISSVCIFPMESFSKKWLKYAHTGPIEKYNFTNAMIWEINFPWNDGAKNWWSMEWCCRPMTDWNQASI